MFDEQANTEVTKGFAEQLLVVSPVGGMRPEVARIPAGDLLGDVSVTPLPSRQAAYVKNGLRVSIDEIRDPELFGNSSAGSSGGSQPSVRRM